MQQESYILRTARGAPVYSYASLSEAQREREAHQARVKVPLSIFRQRIVEEQVA